VRALPGGAGPAVTADAAAGPAPAPSPIARCLDAWHSVITGGGHAALDSLVAEDAVFLSPVVYTPQRGKALVVRYLTGAMMTFGGDAPGSPDAGVTRGAGGADRATAAGTTGVAAGDSEGTEWDGRFRYVRRLLDTHDAVLEFETTMGSTYVNGVDMIRCDDDGRIVEFKVMIRPLQAVNAVHELMARALDALDVRPMRAD
jgi:ketosteroid isomerase-like protein